MLARPVVVFVAFAASGSGAALLGHQAYMKVKAVVAERLIRRAWSAHLADGHEHRPWRWADVTPVARVTVPRLGVDRVVLSGATGQALAFGLGHVGGTTRPGAPGHVVIAGHRDTWASFLRELQPGDEVRVATRTGTRRWTVVARRVVAQDDTAVLDPVMGDRLSLMTCYPFDGVRRSPWRYVVTCEPGGPWN